MGDRMKELQLTPHFKLKEFFVSNTNQKHADILLARASSFQVDMCYFIACALEELRAQVEVPLFITSCIRDTALNNLVGGSPNSLHLRCLAVDFKTARKEDMRFMPLLFDYAKQFLPLSELFLYETETGEITNIHLALPCYDKPKLVNGIYIRKIDGNKELIV